MKRNIVEGEPGIFPAPIAQLLTRFNRWVRRRLGKGSPPSPPGEGDRGPGTGEDRA